MHFNVVFVLLNKLKQEIHVKNSHGNFVFNVLAISVIFGNYKEFFFTRLQS